MVDHLSTTFEELTSAEGESHRPFRWQARLLRRLLDADLPRVVDIPTGLGKTSVMALWLIARGERAPVPRRLVYVVDRRAVVDQATRFAQRLRENMPRELEAKLGLDADAGLPISTLRGGFADNRDWLEDPSKPAIVVGTVDMIGSRLLFEGYGVSRGMRPYHAGLLGVDTLVLLDEAHLCLPFEALLRQIELGGNGRLGPLGNTDWVMPRFRLMSLSATGRDDVPEATPSAAFRLEPEDREEPVVRQRLTAHKRLKVTELNVGTSLPESLADRAIEVGCDAPFSRVLVYCNRRTDAVRVKELIDRECRRRNKAGLLPGKHVVELLVGERRVWERATLETWLDTYGFLGAADKRPIAPTFLIATSAGEVGVDLNADHMICDLVACERMVQRLGRVNRRGGKDRRAMIDVLAPRPERQDKTAKEPQGSPDFETMLAPLFQLSNGVDGRRDASPAAIVEMRAEWPGVVRAATTPAPLYPELTRPLLDAWSMTSLRHHEGRPEVAPWLRGWEQDDEPQTSVVWRKYLPAVHGGGETTVSPAIVESYFRVVPVNATERLDADSSRVFDWMMKRTLAFVKRVEGDDLAMEDDEVIIMLIDRAGDLRGHLSLRDLRRLAAPAKSLHKNDLRQRDRDKGEWRERRMPGATLVVDCRLGGIRNGMLDDKCDTAAAAADADEVWRRERDPSGDGTRPLIRFLVERVDRGESEEGLAAPRHVDWRHVRTFETRMDAAGAPSSGLAVFKWPDDASDEDSRSVLSEPQSLRDHADQVAEYARVLAQRLELPRDEADALVTAARLHDDGKATERWQTAMNAPREGRPYAKTSGGGNPRLLEGYRHEFGSLLKAEELELPRNTRDLILHLIAAHHGNARPTIPWAGCELGPPSVLESKSGDAAMRFARLQKRYGPWGLAWLEAIVRAADQSASKAWSNRRKESRSG